MPEIVCPGPDSFAAYNKAIELSQEFPKERVEEMNAMVAQVAPYQTWHSRSLRDYSSEPKRHRCQYCRQLSPDDSRGGCAACGGPR